MRALTAQSPLSPEERGCYRPCFRWFSFFPAFGSMLPCLLYGFCFNLVLFKKEILCSLGWPKTPYVAKYDLEFPIMFKY